MNTKNILVAFNSITKIVIYSCHSVVLWNVSSSCDVLLEISHIKSFFVNFSCPLPWDHLVQVGAQKYHLIYMNLGQAVCFVVFFLLRGGIKNWSDHMFTQSTTPVPYFCTNPCWFLFPDLVFNKLNLINKLLDFYKQKSMKANLSLISASWKEFNVFLFLNIFLVLDCCSNKMTFEEVAFGLSSLCLMFD